MAAPTPTARGTPAGIPLKEGHGTKVTFGQATTLTIWEVTVKPPAVEGGDPIDITTMFNDIWEPSSPPDLKRLEDATMTGSYDPDAYDECVDAINRHDTITITFNDGSTLAFFGWLKTFDPQEVAKGAQPRANFTIHPSNYDYVNNVEAGPVMTEVEGT